MHRTGDLDIGDLAVVVAVAADHRDEAFQACRALIEDLKADRAGVEAAAIRRRRERVGEQCLASGEPGLPPEQRRRAGRRLRRAAGCPAGWPGAEPPSRRGITLLVAAAGVLAALIVAATLPVPYVALTPGPTLNTLGTLSGKPLIQVSGHPTYPTSGHLNMVTVSYIGGPQSHFNVFAALRSWLTPSDAVVPAEEIFTPGSDPAAGAAAGHRGDDQLPADRHRRRPCAS